MVGVGVDGDGKPNPSPKSRRTTRSETPLLAFDVFDDALAPLYIGNSFTIFCKHLLLLFESSSFMIGTVPAVISPLVTLYVESHPTS